MSLETNPDLEMDRFFAQAEKSGEDPFDLIAQQSGEAVADEKPEQVAAGEEQQAVEEAPVSQAPEGEEAPAENAPAGEAPAEDAAQSKTSPAVGKDNVLGINTQPLNFTVSPQTDYKEVRAALLAEKAEALTQVLSGEIDGAAYAAIESRVLEKLDELSAARATAQALQEASRQSNEQVQQAVVAAIVARGDVQYVGNQRAMLQFDAALMVEAQLPENQGKSYAELALLANAAVVAQNQGAVKPNTAPPARPAPAALPVTLQGLPTAATGSQKTVSQVLAGASGADFESAFDQLPAGEMEKLLSR